VMSIGNDANQAKVDADQAGKALETIRQRVAGTAGGEAQKVAEAEVEQARLALEAADKAAAAAAERLKAAESAKSEIEKIAKAAAEKAAEKNTNFAAWSDLITVVVVEPSKK